MSETDKPQHQDKKTNITRVDKNILTPEFIKKCSKSFLDRDQYTLAKNAVTGTRVEKISLERTQVQGINHVFSKTIETLPDITDQENSGRCWLFAFLNTLRVPMIKKYHLEDDFEFSQTYPFFWDKFEKCYCFLQRMVETRDMPLDCELVRHLVKEPQQDGGDWYMFVDIVEKYGLIPKSQMNETYQSEHSSSLDETLNQRLHDYAYRIRKFSPDTKPFEIESYLETCMLEIYRILVIFLGEPPQNFIWERYQHKDHVKKSKKTKHSKNSKRKKKSKKSKKSKNSRIGLEDRKDRQDGGGGKKVYKTSKEITPLEFYQKWIPTQLDNLVALIHYPSRDKKMWTQYNIKYSENIYGGRNTNYLNVPIDEIVQASKKSIDGGNPVWFGGDVSYHMSNKHGIMDPDSYNTRLLFGFESSRIEKGERLRYYGTCPNHAMVINGYNMDSKKREINRWRVENSWGDDVGDDGYYTMTQKWFDEYLFEIVVDRKYVSKRVLDVAKRKPVVLPPWDPFGGLAKS